MRKITCCLCIVFLWVVMFIQSTLATEVQIKRFKAGEVIYADDVNGNFQALADTVKQLQTLVTELEKRNKTLEEKNRALEAKIATLEQQMATIAKTPQPSTTQVTASKTPRYRLRSQGKTVSEAQAQQEFNLDATMSPRTYIVNDFEVQGEVVIDHATGLMWQKAGSRQEMAYVAVPSYLQQLNVGFAGYKDWRLPTIDELLSLLEVDKQSNGLYISPVFDSMQRWCWSVDLASSKAAWNVYLQLGEVAQHTFDYVYYVRAVRTLQ